jgi:NitT/TauT family transport system permease protein
MATAMAEGNIPALLEAIVAMVVVIVLVDQLFWRPVVAWSQKFKMELSNAADHADSWFLQLLRRSKVSAWIANHVFGALFRSIDALVLRWVMYSRERSRHTRGTRALRRAIAVVCWIGFGAVVLYYGWIGVREISQLGIRDIGHVVLLGLFTLLRVMASTGLALLWTIPVGVAIGLNAKASRIAQPLVQILASFPANMFFPLIALLYLRLHVNFQIGAIPLMMLGTQWYILFNVIAGTQAIPNDLKEATKVLGLRGWTKWKTLILPCIFPYVVTGCITASGGAWNASIIAELVSWRDTTLVASGIGAFITQTTQTGEWPKIILGIVIMAVLVTLVNRLLWRPLYQLADRRYRIEVSGR